MSAETTHAAEVLAPSKLTDDNYLLFIDGTWRKSAEGKTFKAFNPANGELLATCADAGCRDVDLAVSAAWRANESWKNVSPQERSRLLLRIADLIDANADRLAMVETLDKGTPIRETAMVDVPSAADHFRYFAGVVRTEEGKAVMIDKDTMSLILHEPIGVVGQIIPWNYPFLMAAWKIAPALAAGDCVVIKPSSATSLSLLELAKLLAEVLPPGVVNVITGTGSGAGNHMLEHEGFRKLAFTGSTEVGYSVGAAAAKRLIPATLELGGKSASIFFPDAPWQKAIEGLQLGILFNQGEVCAACSRAFVHEAIYDRFLDAAVEAFRKVKVDLPWKPDAQMGTLISEAHMNKVLGYVAIGKAEGAKVATGGARITGRGLGKGSFVEPTILTEVDNHMRVAQEEIFGPVVVIIKFQSEDEVVRWTNESEYGLAGAVWTRDINRALRVARGVEAGRMWVNNCGGAPAHAPFGGYKKSGIGRETHQMMLEHYSQKKNIFISMSEAKLGLY